MFQYRRMPIEAESPEEVGYEKIKYNLAESSMPDFVLGRLPLDLQKLVLCYGDHRGLPDLRQLLANEAANLTANDLLLTTGAGGALFIAATSLLGAQDRLLVVRPNYANNLETPRAMGAAVDYYDLRLENGFRYDIDALVAQLTPQTRLVSLTSPHNPTGSMLLEEDLRRLIQIIESRPNLFLLLDETYRDMAQAALPPLAASLSDRVISVGSFSKSYGLPGIRLGWLACRNAALMETFLAAKEQIWITNSVVDETIALEFLKQKQNFWPQLSAQLKENLAIVRRWIENEPRMTWAEPQGGCVCFPCVKAEANVNMDVFYRLLFDEWGTLVGPGHWFEMDRRFMRIGFGWVSAETLQTGLANISLALTQASRA